MIKQILKIIWIERKLNIWILLELIFVFSILWFCTDYLYFMAKRNIEPIGFNIEHTYRINIGNNKEGQRILRSDNEEAKEQMLTEIWTIYDRIKSYSAISDISISVSAMPYSDSWSSNEFMYDSTKTTAQIKKVAPCFFDVFKIDILTGNRFTDENIVSQDLVIIGGQRNNVFGEKKSIDIKEIATPISKNEYEKLKVVGVANTTKKNQFDDYNNIVYYPIKKNDMSVLWGGEICVRVKPDADNNFADQFTENMRSQLEIGNYYLSSVTSLDNARKNHLDRTGYYDNFKSIFSISSFLIINIFLGFIGTFWFRIESRRNEIGLRLSLGSTKGQIKKMFIYETLILIFIASIIASVICINISLGDILKDINVPIPDRGEAKTDMAQHFINYSITFLFISLISLFAVWYPANKASKTQPAEVLKSE